MKRNIISPVFLTLLSAFVLLLMFEGCKKSTESPNQDPTADLMLTGSVINAATNSGIANATVHIGDQIVIRTDAAGVYRISSKTLGTGVFDVRVMSEGFGYGFALANVGSNAAMVNIIKLKPLATAETIGQSGGTISREDTESLLASGVSRLSVPGGALTANVGVTFTRLTGIEVPGYAPENFLNACAISIGPAETVLSKPAELRLALPFSKASVSTLPLLKYDFVQNQWTNTGIIAQIDQVTNTASAEISTFGTYSLGVEGSYAESEGTSGSTTTIALNTAQSYTDFTFLAKNLYTAGIPYSISPVYLRNLASQNTRLYGARISFTESTIYAYNYIGYKPDSLVPVKSTASGYYRWAPKASHSLKEFPMTTILQGVAVTGIIEKEAYTNSSGWQYIHDQGGGGK